MENFRLLALLDSIHVALALASGEHAADRLRKSKDALLRVNA